MDGVGGVGGAVQGGHDVWFADNFAQKFFFLKDFENLGVSSSRHEIKDVLLFEARKRIDFAGGSRKTALQ